MRLALGAARPHRASSSPRPEVRRGRRRPGVVSLPLTLLATRAMRESDAADVPRRAPGRPGSTSTAAPSRSRWRSAAWPCWSSARGRQSARVADPAASAPAGGRGTRARASADATMRSWPRWPALALVVGAGLAWLEHRAAPATHRLRSRQARPAFAVSLPGETRLRGRAARAAAAAAPGAAGRRAASVNAVAIANVLPARNDAPGRSVFVETAAAVEPSREPDRRQPRRRPGYFAAMIRIPVVAGRSGRLRARATTRRRKARVLAVVSRSFAGSAARARIRSVPGPPRQPDAPALTVVVCGGVVHQWFARGSRRCTHRARPTAPSQLTFGLRTAEARRALSTGGHARRDRGDRRGAAGFRRERCAKALARSTIRAAVRCCCGDKARSRCRAATRGNPGASTGDGLPRRARAKFGVRLALGRRGATCWA